MYSGQKLTMVARCHKNQGSSQGMCQGAEIQGKNNDFTFIFAMT